jgi:hypothetical protein
MMTPIAFIGRSAARRRRRRWGSNIIVDEKGGGMVVPILFLEEPFRSYHHLEGPHVPPCPSGLLAFARPGKGFVEAGKISLMNRGAGGVASPDYWPGYVLIGWSMGGVLLLVRMDRRGVIISCLRSQYDRLPPGLLPALIGSHGATIRGRGGLMTR